MLLPVCCVSAVATKQRLLLSHASSERPQKLKGHEQNTQRQRDRHRTKKKRKKEKRLLHMKAQKAVIIRNKYSPA
jgi:hypothetical protein